MRTWSPASQLREAYSRIRELERLVGKKQMEIEILEAVRDAETVLAQLGEWFDDYNTRAPHSALGMRSPANYRAAVTLSSSR